MRECWRNIGDLIAEPRALFTRLKAEPKWGGAFTIFLLLYIGLVFIEVPVTEQFIILHFTETGSTLSNQLRMPLIISSSLIGILLTVASILLLSALLTGASRFFQINPSVKFRHIYASFVHLSLIERLIQIINTALLFVFKDIAEIQRSVDTQMIPGLHHLVGFIENDILLMFLSYLNLLNVWYVAVLTVGIQVFAEVSKWKAFLTGIVIWMLGVGILSVLVS